MSSLVFSDFRDPEFAEEFARRRHGRAERTGRRITRLAGIGPGERVVDLCCGPGLVAELLAEQVGRAGEVIGIDVSPAMIALASSNVRRRNVQFVEGDAYSFSSLIEGEADHVVATSAWQHFLLDRERVLVELKHALRAGGRFSFDVRMRGQALGGVRAWDVTAREVVKRWPEFVPPDVPLHPRYSESELRRDLELIERAGFRLLRVREVDEFPEAAWRDRQGWRVECWLAREAPVLPEEERAEILSEVERALTASADAAFQRTTYVVAEAT